MSTHHVPIPKVGTLVGVFVTLIILTFVTTVVSYINLGEFNVIVALLIALCKASIVAWIFMGVRYTTSLTKLFVVAGLVWLSILILLTYSDYSSRHWIYHARPWNNHTKAPMFER
ncbi:MAG: cytochrome C oxidase subunit IV family protein [Bryobacteraceae bacterium]